MKRSMKMMEIQSHYLIKLMMEMKENGLIKLLLKEAIRELEERERLIVYLRYYKDQTQSEVAVRLGISQVQVSRLEKKILQQMKDRMDI